MNIFILKQLTRAGFTHEQLRTMSRAERALAMAMAEANDAWQRVDFSFDAGSETYIPNHLTAV